MIIVTNDLDTLATALYVRADDLLKEAPDLAPWRLRVGIAPKLSDAELVTLAVMQVGGSPDNAGAATSARCGCSTRGNAGSPRCGCSDDRFDRQVPKPLG